jgi:zinc transport system permease protein
MLDLLGELFSYTFILRALTVGMLVALCSALLGVSLVLKRYSMIGDGLSHVGFGALSVAMVMNLPRCRCRSRSWSRLRFCFSGSVRTAR